MNRIMRWKMRRGISLLVVLGSLVFLSALILAFLSGVSTELKSSKLYADASSTRLLAQSAVNIVMAEIKDATSGKNLQGEVLCWASQPGMIRTYNDRGNKDRYFKLFSSDSMVGTGDYDPSSSKEMVPASWFNDTAIFADLNQPERVNGNWIFPIIDGNHLKIIGGKLSYDVDNNGQEDVDGFYVDGAPVGGGRHPNPIPMPVRWLYVLSNGDVVAPTGSGEKATVVGAEKNEIVGRIAFWTDDECSKININTASDAYTNSTAATYWDVPKFSTQQDMSLSYYQGAQHEYQRYPGHPATVALSSVLNRPSSMTGAQWSEEIYKMVPRIVGGEGSSKGGTVAGTTTLTPDEDRLYATVDEFMFNTTLSGETRNQNNASSITDLALEKKKFFLTATSRAPDVNLFNKPQVSVWPVSSFDDSSHRTVFDKLAAFCSTVGGHLFYFQRSNATSPTADLPTAGSATGLGRNRQLLDYLRSLAAKSIPGFGGNFATKYSTSNGVGGTDCDQILTEIFDYIRSTNNDDSTVKIPFNVKNTTVAGATEPYLGSGEVVPIFDQKTNTRGFGRYDTIQGAFLMIVGTAQAGGRTTMQAIFCVNTFNPAMGYPWYQPNHGFIVDGLQNFTWVGVDNTNTPLPAVSMGFPAGTTKNVKVSFKTGGSISNDYMIGGSIDFVHYAIQQLQAPDTYQLISTTVNQINQDALPAVPTKTFAFTGGDVTIKVLAPDNTTVIQTVVLNFPNTTLPVPQLAPSVIPPTQVPPNGRNYQKLIGGAGGGSPARMKGNTSRPLICAKDVVRAIVPAVGDMRLIMARGGLASQPIKPTDTTYSSFFAPHANYSIPTEIMAHNLRSGSMAPLYGATAGRLLNLSYDDSQTTPYTQNNPETTDYTLWTRDSSVVPTANVDIIGDWDNGVGAQPDGPYINKADEGTSTSAKSGKVPYYGWDEEGNGATLFSPNRMFPSAGMFGSLPTGVWANQPWQTLLFCPNPLKGNTHPGFGTPISGPPFTTPPDYLLLDLFHMPIVEPYAISEPLSTAGKINMNYQIVPFTYINRDTGLRAVLKGEKVIAVPDSMAATYKTQSMTKSNSNASQYRLEIDPDETLKGFQARFNSHDIFRSASEICSINLIPEDQTYSGIATFWNDKRLTGDNSRERPYTTLYPRLTTKSNTYTVHVWAQTLKKTKETPAGVWVEGKDRVTGEYRGSQVIERYVDPQDANLIATDFADSSVSKVLGDFYKFRLLTTKQFLP